MFQFVLVVSLDGGRVDNIDLESDEIFTRDGKTTVPFVGHSLGKDNVRCQDAVLAGARGLVGATHDSGSKITQVQVVRITLTDEILETFTQAS